MVWKVDILPATWWVFWLTILAGETEMDDMLRRTMLFIETR